MGWVCVGDCPAGEVGTVFVGNDGKMTVVCGGGTGLVLEEVQMEGKKRMAAAEFLRGYQVKTGERVGE